MGTPGVKLKLRDIEKAIRKSNGVLAQAAAMLKCDRVTVWKWVTRHPHLQELREQAGETLLDVAESNVHRGLYASDPHYTRWFLDRRGQERGYSSKTELTGSGGGPLGFVAIERVAPGTIEPLPQRLAIESKREDD